jgi:CheY-like chemotaxis protein
MQSQALVMPLAGKSFLLLEDDLIIATSVEDGLREAGGPAVTAAHTLAQARNILNGPDKFDAAIVDLRLPDGDATPLINIPTSRGTPVVVATAALLDHLELSSKEHVRVLEKPFGETALIEALRQITG